MFKGCVVTFNDAFAHQYVSAWIVSPDGTRVWKKEYDTTSQSVTVASYQAYYDIATELASLGAPKAMITGSDYTILRSLQKLRRNTRHQSNRFCRQIISALTVLDDVEFVTLHRKTA